MHNSTYEIFKKLIKTILVSIFYFCKFIHYDYS